MSGGKISTARGHVQSLRGGERVEGQAANEARMIAAIGGRIELVIGEHTALLRASDAAVIPARARYRLHALEDATVYHAPGPEPQSGDENLWGV